MLIIIIILLLILILAYQPSREFLFGIFALGSTLAIMIVIGAVVLIVIIGIIMISSQALQ
jgi:hypothetical protein